MLSQTRITEMQGVRTREDHEEWGEGGEENQAVTAPSAGEPGEGSFLTLARRPIEPTNAGTNDALRFPADVGESDEAAAGGGVGAEAGADDEPAPANGSVPTAER